MNADKRRSRHEVERRGCCWHSKRGPIAYGRKDHRYYIAAGRYIVWMDSETVGWVVTVLAVAGVLLNNFRLWPCFIVWIISNALSGYIHYRIGLRSLIVRDLIFLVLAIAGLWQWTR